MSVAAMIQRCADPWKKSMSKSRIQNAFNACGMSWHSQGKIDLSVFDDVASMAAKLEATVGSKIAARTISAITVDSKSQEETLSEVSKRVFLEKLNSMSSLWADVRQSVPGSMMQNDDTKRTFNTAVARIGKDLAALHDLLP
jgi:hypothetical protein